MFEVRMDFRFWLNIRYVSGEAVLSSWTDAVMDIQYIWLGLTLCVVGGMTNLGTVMNGLELFLLLVQTRLPQSLSFHCGVEDIF